MCKDGEKKLKWIHTHLTTTTITTQADNHTQTHKKEPSQKVCRTCLCVICEMCVLGVGYVPRTAPIKTKLSQVFTFKMVKDRCLGRGSPSGLLFCVAPDDWNEPNGLFVLVLYEQICGEMVGR